MTMEKVIDIGLKIFTAGRQNQFVSCYLGVIITNECYILKEIFFPQQAKGL